MRVSDLKFYVLMFCIGLLLVVSMLGTAKRNQPPKFKGGDGVTLIDKTIVIDDKYVEKHGKEIDLKNMRYLWIGEVGEDDQQEGLPPIFSVTVDGVTLKNFVVENSPDGIHINANKVWIENVRFVKVLEDAITVKKGAEDAMIKGCQFNFGEDKVVMISNGKKHRITECVFRGAETPIKVSHGSTARVWNNWFIDCQYGVRADGFDLETRLVLGKNNFVRCRNLYLFNTKFGKLMVSSM